jgi:hypothetical protein
MVAE